MKAALILALMAIAPTAFATINGTDDRKEAALEPRFKEIARATAMMISPAYVNENSHGRLDLDFLTLGDADGWNVCKDEKFVDQPAQFVNCTGFLVAPDILVTAGHCAVKEGTIENKRNEYCENFNWLFDYAVGADGKVVTKNIDKSKLVGCKRVIYATLDFDTASNGTFQKHKADYAIIQLDRSVGDRPVLKLAAGEPSLADLVSIVGYPTGLPVKVAADARILSVDDPNYALTTLDALGGNSGSPVLNAKNEVAGILVRAFPDEDYVDDGANACRRPNKCSGDATQCANDATDFPRGSHMQKIRDVRSRLGF